MCAIKESLKISIVLDESSDSIPSTFNYYITYIFGKNINVDNTPIFFDKIDDKSVEKIQEDLSKYINKEKPNVLCIIGNKAWNFLSQKTYVQQGKKVSLSTWLNNFNCVPYQYSELGIIKKALNEIKITSSNENVFENNQKLLPFVPYGYIQGQKYTRILVIGDRLSHSDKGNSDIVKEKKIQDKILTGLGFEDSNGKPLLENVAYYQFFIKDNEKEDYNLQILTSVIEILHPSQILIIGDDVWSFFLKKDYEKDKAYSDLLTQIQQKDCFITPREEPWDGYFETRGSIDAIAQFGITSILDKMFELCSELEYDHGSRADYEKDQRELIDFYKENPNEFSSKEEMNKFLENQKDDFFEFEIDKLLDEPAKMYQKLKETGVKTDYYLRKLETSRPNYGPQIRRNKKNSVLITKILDFLMKRNIALPYKKISEAMMYVNWLNKIHCPNDNFDDALEWALGQEEKLPKELGKVPGIINKPEPFPYQNKGIEKKLNLAYVWLRDCGAEHEKYLANVMQTFFVKGDYSQLMTPENCKEKKVSFWHPKEEKKIKNKI